MLFFVGPNIEYIKGTFFVVFHESNAGINNVCSMLNHPPASGLGTCLPGQMPEALAE